MFEPQLQGSLSPGLSRITQSQRGLLEPIAVVGHFKAGGNGDITGVRPEASRVAFLTKPSPEPLPHSFRAFAISRP
jgi:hypothetical protein